MHSRLQVVGCYFAPLWRPADCITAYLATYSSMLQPCRLMGVQSRVRRLTSTMVALRWKLGTLMSRTLWPSSPTSGGSALHQGSDLVDYVFCAVNDVAAKDDHWWLRRINPGDLSGSRDLLSPKYTP